MRCPFIKTKLQHGIILSLYKPFLTLILLLVKTVCYRYSHVIYMQSQNQTRWLKRFG